MPGPRGRLDPSADLVVFVIVAISVVPGVVERLLLAAAKGTQEFRYLSQASLGGNLFYAVCAIGAVMLGYGIHALLLSLLARRIVTILLIGWQLPTHYSLRGALPFAVPAELRRRLLLYCRDVSLILVIDTVLYERSELYFLKRFATEADIAFYSQSFDLALKSMAIPAIFSGVLLPTFSSLAGQRETGELPKRFRFFAPVIVSGPGPDRHANRTGGAAITPAFVLLYGPDFLPMSPVLSILLVGNIVGALASVSATILHSVDEQNFIVRLGLGVAVLNIGFGFLLIPRYGAIGAALATPAASLFPVLWASFTPRGVSISLFRCAH